jgi:hypothetical protein
MSLSAAEAGTSATAEVPLDASADMVAGLEVQVEAAGRVINPSIDSGDQVDRFELAGA